MGGLGLVVLGRGSEKEDEERMERQVQADAKYLGRC